MTARKLIVEKASMPDVYRSIVRINENDRKTSSGDPIGESKVMRVRVGKKSVLAWARGNEDKSGVIVLDDVQRRALDVTHGNSYDFMLDQGPAFASLRWAFAHPDPIYRVSAWLGTVSVGLGVLSILLAVAIPILQRLFP